MLWSYNSYDLPRRIEALKLRIYLLCILITTDWKPQTTAINLYLGQWVVQNLLRRLHMAAIQKSNFRCEINLFTGNLNHDIKLKVSVFGIVDHTDMDPLFKWSVVGNFPNMWWCCIVYLSPTKINDLGVFFFENM